MTSKEYSASEVAGPAAHVRVNDSTPTSRFPDSLRQERRWLAWKVSEDASEKTPISPITGRHASSKDSSTWANFDDAHAFAKTNSLALGLAINNNLPDLTPIVAIDFDHVTAKGEPAPQWVADVCAELGSFTERSISGTGFHTFVYGELAKGVNTITGATIEKSVHGGDQKVELFNHKMVVVTGDCLPGMTTIKAASTEKLVELGERAKTGFGKIKKPVASVSTSLMLTNPVAERLAILERGESPTGDRSEGDFQYCALLAELGLSDSEIDSRFRASARMREKWDAKHFSDGRTYGEGTISRVRKQHAAKLTGKPDPTANPEDWRGLFHSKKETLEAPPITFAINGFLQEGGVTMIGALPGHGKTLVALSMAKALLEGKPLFGHFHTPRKSDRVLYLIPESSLSPFAARLKTFRLVDYVADRLFYRTLSSPEDVLITDPRILKAAEGADVFLDTAIRFMDDAGNESESASMRMFSKNLFALVKAGARTVTGLHHSPKDLSRAKYLTLENVLRGSGEIGAALVSCWGMFQVEKRSNRIFIECVKPRDFEPAGPFMVEGRPYLDSTGEFLLVAAPGICKAFSQVKKGGGRPADPHKDEKLAKAIELRKTGRSLRETAKAIGVDHKTIKNWLAEAGEPAGEAGECSPAYGEGPNLDGRDKPREGLSHQTDSKTSLCGVGNCSVPYGSSPLPTPKMDPEAVVE